MGKFALVAVLCGALTPLGVSEAIAGCQPSDDVVSSLQCIDGLTVEEKPSTIPDYRYFEMTYTQPVDQTNPAGEKFTQRLVLLHHSFNDPMVLQTSGYNIFGVSLTRLAKTFGANQIQIEHRYFGDSKPASGDWSKLNIEQSAADFHRITTAFKELYRTHWVGTGASKGGMTSVYHRRFYPNDLDGTVADVAPLSFSKEDQRYVTFVDDVGGDTYRDCRSSLYQFQVDALNRRDELLALVDGSYAILGGKGVAFEHALVELPFIFWQYGNPEDPDVGCAQIPSATAPTDQFYAFLKNVNDVAGYADDSFDVFAAYYFQAGTQLGGPASKLDHLAGLRLYNYSLDMYMPPGGPYAYSNAEMQSVRDWVQQEASSVMFVYGEFDPWSAGAFPQVGERDSHWYKAPKGNHGAKFNLLSDADKTEAVATLTRWFGRAPITDVERRDFETTLDDLEQKARRQRHLP